MPSVDLFHFRWSLPVLAELAGLQGAKLVTLANALGVGRETLRRTLDALVDAGLVARNPGARARAEGAGAGGPRRASRPRRLPAVDDVPADRPARRLRRLAAAL